LYRKRQRNGQLTNGTAKYFYVTAETALLVLLINLARPIAFCDMQASLNGIPFFEISLIVNFMLEYVEPWCAACQDLSTWLPRFHLYADAIVAKGSRIGVGNNCRVVEKDEVPKRCDFLRWRNMLLKATFRSSSFGLSKRHQWPS